MIVGYSSEYREDVLKLISSRKSFVGLFQKYIFENFSDIYRESSFVFIEDGIVKGYIGTFVPMSRCNIDIFALASYNMNISKYLLEHTIIYANKNKIKNLSFSVSADNYYILSVFRELTERLKLSMEKSTMYIDDRIYQITYNINLDKKSKNTI